VSEPTTIHLIHGEESFLVQEQGTKILAGWRQGLVSDFGLDILDPAAGADHLRDAVMQAPFLDPHRVVVVRSVPPRRADSLAPALDFVADSTRLLITVAGPVRASSQLVKAVKRAGGQVSEHGRLKPRQLADWIRERTRAYGLPALAAASLVKGAIPDLGVIDSELQKLAAYRAGGHELDPASIAELLVAGREGDIFNLTDGIVPVPGADSMRTLDSLLGSESPTAISFRLARHLALVLEVATRQRRGESLAQVQGELSQHPFVVQKAYEAARRTEPERLEAGLEALLDYEWKVKSGQIDAEWGLRVALTRL